MERMSFSSPTEILCLGINPIESKKILLGHTNADWRLRSKLVFLCISSKQWYYGVKKTTVTVVFGWSQMTTAFAQGITAKLQREIVTNGRLMWDTVGGLRLCPNINQFVKDAVKKTLLLFCSRR